MQYRVVWEIDVDADSFEDAARIAQVIQRDTESTATCFTVMDEHGKTRDVDLGQADTAKRDGQHESVCGG